MVNAEATAAACEKADELREEFDRWLLHEEPTRSGTMLAIYNERFNSYVARNYAGAKIAAPGLAANFVLRPHQEQAIARVIFGGNTALWHPVGAGKTAEMIVSGMEQRRLGIIRRPAYVVPNHMLEEFSREFLHLYPAAHVLTVAKDEISPKERHLFAARTRSHDWDAVIITHSSFGRWPVSASVESEVISRRIGEMRAEKELMAVAGDPASRTLAKNIERSVARFEAKVEALQARIASHQDEHDFPFDQSGVDYLYVDEAHEFKNAELHSVARNLRGVPVGDGSQRAMELDTKLRWMRAAYPGRQITMATGTPVSNTVAELWVAIRYLRPLRAELHLTHHWSSEKDAKSGQRIRHHRGRDSSEALQPEPIPVRPSSQAVAIDATMMGWRMSNDERSGVLPRFAEPGACRRRYPPRAAASGLRRDARRVDGTDAVEGTEKGHHRQASLAGAPVCLVYQ